MAPLLWLTGAALAVEGMWMPEQLPALGEELKGLGLELPPESLADPMAWPLGAIVSLGFCSASFVSPDGLIVTNHHCVEGYLQVASDEQHNYVSDGYAAPSRAEEASGGPVARIYVVESITDVTAELQRAASRARSDADRYQRVAEARKALVARCEATPNHRCEVESFFGGKEVRLVSNLEIQDVRLVYAPPESVGSYGGEIDNWMWPRHAGDFALIRAYVAPDGSSAPYAKENVPFHPAHHLKIAKQGLAPGDFVMAAGFPGSTLRYRSAADMRSLSEHGYPFELELMRQLEDLYAEEANTSAEAASRVGPAVSYIGNDIKYIEGMLDNFASSGVVARKEAEDAALRAWVAADPSRARYGQALDAIEAIRVEERAHNDRDALVGLLMATQDLLGVAHSALRFAGERPKKDLDRDEGYQDRDLLRARQRFQALDETMWLPADRRAFSALLLRLMGLPAEEQIAPLNAWVKSKGSPGGAYKALFDAPALATSEARLALLTLSEKQLRASPDPWVQLAVAMESFLSVERQRDHERQGALLRLEPLVAEARIASRGGRVYPDANSSLRITYGTVMGYSPADGVQYTPFTTLPGMVAKAGEAPFDAPERFLAAAEKPSPYADPRLGQVPVDFLSDLDSTGGNSGSATLNAKGELVGLLFDGNYESMSADWLFDPALTRSIHVDVRYLLWTLSEVEHMDAVLAELGG